MKHAIQRYEEQAKKKPELAKEIKSNFDQGISTYVTRTPPMSSSSLHGMEKPNKKDDDSTVDEKTALLAAVAKSAAGGTGDSPDNRSSLGGSPNSPSSGVQNVLRSAVSSVSGYFEKRYETALRDTLGDIVAKENDFDNKLLQEVRMKV